MPQVKPISLDGSTLEGGGQLVRVAFSLSAITGIPVHVYNIRANRMAKGRSKGNAGGGGRGGRGSLQRRGGGGSGDSDESGGGAKESHLAALLWLAGRCDAFVEGAEVGSREVTFIPGGGQGKNERQKNDGENGLVDLERNTINLERPGSTCLILQCILPYLLFTSPTSSISSTSSLPTPKLAQTATAMITTATQQTSSLQLLANDDLSHTDQPSMTTEITLFGGTNVSKAMTTDYVQHIFLPMLRRILGPSLPEVTLENVRRGWAGSASQIGEVKVRVTHGASGPMKIENVTTVERGDIEKISVVIVAEGTTARQEITDGLKREIPLLFTPDLPIETIVNEDSGDVRRLYVLLIAHTTNGYRLGRDFLGSGRRPKNTAEQKKIIEECVRTVTRDLSREVKRGGCVDEFMADQIILFQALARGMGRVDAGKWRESGNGKGVDVEVGDKGGSLHARTVRWVCERVLKGVGDGVDFKEGGYCKGVGWSWDATDTEEKRSDQSVEADMKRLDFEKGRQYLD